MSTEQTAPAAGEQPNLADLSYEQFEEIRGKGEMPSDKTSEAPAAEQDAKTASESDTERKGNDEPRKGGFQRRIDKLTREKYALEARVRELETGRPAAKPAGEPKSETAQKPQPEQYRTYDEYVEALAEFKADQKVSKAKEEFARETQERAAKSQAEQTLASWNQRVETARGKYEDFDDIVDSDLPITQPMQAAIIDSEHGAEIAYHLGKHPDEAERISRLSPMAAIREIGKIEAQIVQAPKPKPSAASRPLSPVKGRAGQIDLNDPKLTYEDWEKQRNAQLRSSR